MRRSSTSSLVAGIAIAMAMASAALAQRAPATGVRALANVRELHDIMISPASDAVFDATSQQPLDEKAGPRRAIRRLSLPNPPTC